MAGGGMITASSAAFECEIVKAESATAPTAAARSETRLNWLADIVASSWDGDWRFLIAVNPKTAAGRHWRSTGPQRYATKQRLLPVDAHEFVSEIAVFSSLFAPKRWLGLTVREGPSASPHHDKCPLSSRRDIVLRSNPNSDATNDMAADRVDPEQRVRHTTMLSRFAARVIPV